MIRITICEDELEYQEKLIRKLHEMSSNKMTDVSIKAYYSGNSMLVNYDDWIDHSDVVFMDVKLGDGNGIDIARQIRKLGFKGEIVFLTSSKEYVFESFDVKPLNYLLKNQMNSERSNYEFNKIIDAVRERVKILFTYHVGKNKHVVEINKIVSFEVRKRIIHMSYIGANDKVQKVEFYSKIEEIEGRLCCKGFIKPHRSFFINPMYIDRVGKTNAVLCNEEVIPISRNFKDEFLKGFYSYVEENTIEL